MVWDVLVGSVFSSFAGLTLALLTALLTEHREQRRWLQTKVHQPLYGELTNVVSGELPGDDGEYESLWAGLEYYKAYRVDADLARALDRYASDVSELAGHERRVDFETYVAALPDEICDGEAPVAEGWSGRTVDMRTWLKRNALVLSLHPTVRAAGYGLGPADLDFLWAEVDGLSAADIDSGRVDTAEVLERVSVEFNWGYEGFYEQWDGDWVDVLVEAFLRAAEESGTVVEEVLSLRLELGTTASGIKAQIESRSERGLFRSLWEEWTGP